MKLRDYQILGKQMIYTAFKEGYKRIIYWAATGSGKTVSFCDITGECSRNDLPVVIVMRRRELIFQTSKTLDEFGIKHGVYMAGHHRYRPKELVQVCSIDTLDARSLYPHAERENRIIIIDECHDVNPRSKKYMKLFDQYPDDHIIGFTATPFNDNSLSEKIICPIENHELRDQGRLVPDRTFVPSLIDVSGVSIKGNGEFNEQELFEVAAKKEIIGDFVRDWKLYGQGRPTILFAVNIEHSKMICESYNEAGIKAVHCDAKTNSEDRKRAIDRLVKGRIQVLCNVNIFCVDDQTEILTKDGWKNHHTIQKDDIAANYDDGEIWFSRLKGVVVRDRNPDEKMVSVNTTFANIRVTENHRMLSKTYPPAKYKIKTAGECVNKRLFYPVSGASSPQKFLAPLTDFQKNNRYKESVLIAKSAWYYRKKGYSHEEAKELAIIRLNQRKSERHLAPHELSIDQCRLIGFFLGDGSEFKENGYFRYSASQSERYPHIIKWVDSLLTRLGINFSKSKTKAKKSGHYDAWAWALSKGTGCSQQRVKGIFEIIPYLNKEGNRLLHGLTVKQFEGLIEGLILADGLHYGNNTDVFNHKQMLVKGTLKSLYEVLQEVAICRGYESRLLPLGPPRQSNHSPQYSIMFSKRERKALTKYRLQYEKNYKEEKVWCIQTDSGNIITRRGGAVTIMGNSTGVDIPEASCIQVCRPTQSVIWHLQAIGRGLRIAPHVGKVDCIIIDNAGNTLRHGGAYRPREAVIGKPPKRRPDDIDINIRVCKSCYFIFKTSIRVCPQCGYMNPIVDRAINNTDGDLEEYKLSEEELALINKRNFINDFHKLSHVSKMRNFKPDWKYYKLKEKYGLTVCQEYGPMIDMPTYIME